MRRRRRPELIAPDGKRLLFDIQHAEQPTPGRTFEVRGPLHEGAW